MTHNNPEPPRGRWDADRESLWEFVSVRGMDRRQFLRLMMAGGAAAVLAACGGTDMPIETPSPLPTTDVSASNPYPPGSRTPASHCRRWYLVQRKDFQLDSEGGGVRTALIIRAVPDEETGG